MNSISRARAALAACAALLACTAAAVAGSSDPTAAPAPAPAPAASAADPIVVEHCTIDESTSLSDPKLGLRPSLADGVVVNYRNTRDVAATDVHFRIHYQGKTFNVADRGTFAAHATINREFTNINAVFVGDTADCSVASAVFADGTRWDAPEAAAPPTGAPHR